jgi:hypothetical protein
VPNIKEDILLIFQSYFAVDSECHSVSHKVLLNTKYWGINFTIQVTNNVLCRSQWPRGLSRGSATTRLMGMRVRIPPAAWKPVSCECCVLSGRVLCVGLITRTEESYRLWCVWVWSWIPDNKEALAHWGLLRHGKNVLFWKLDGHLKKNVKEHS